MRQTRYFSRTLAGLCLGAVAGCGGPQSTDEAKPAPQAASPEVNDANAAPSPANLVTSPLPENATLTLKVDLSMSAGRDQASSDPLGARSQFKITRSATLACRMVASRPRGVGPDGPTPEQQAMLDAAEATTTEASASVDVPPAAGSMEARVAACGDDEACMMRVALETASDPEQRRAAEAAERGNADVVARINDASARAASVQLEPNWQVLSPDVQAGAQGACEGTITADDKEVYRLGFDGGDMGEGVETRKGSSALTGAPDFQVWYDLKAGRLIIDATLNSVRGRVPSGNVGGRANSRNADFAFNDEWATAAGEKTRLERRSGVTAVPGKWTFTTPVSPDPHRGFDGKVDVAVTVAPR